MAWAGWASRKEEQGGVVGRAGCRRRSFPLLGLSPANSRSSSSTCHHLRVTTVTIITTKNNDNNSNTITLTLLLSVHTNSIYKTVHKP